jgi:tetratricopeptide (TPR) repeat protein
MKIYGILIALLVLAVLILPCAADDSAESFQAAGKLYSDSVDLANAGKYPEALDAADRALAMNVTSLTGVIQSNRAGILVMQKRYDDAIIAADAAIAVDGNLTAAHSIAWYNKGNALRALGRISEARSAYEKAYALDNTLVPPDMSTDVPGVPVSSTQAVPVSPTPKSPLSAGLVLAVLCGLACLGSCFGKK